MRDPSDGVPRIDLMGAGGDGLARAPAAAPDAHMTAEALFRNYTSIVESRAIYYPLAYRFLRSLGRGRQGEVFLGLRQGARGCATEHAIKVFDPSLYRNPAEYWTDMGRIASQVSRLQRVQSPHLVTGNSYEETYGVGYVEMEPVDGVDLRYLLSSRHFYYAMKRARTSEWSRLSGALFQEDKGRLRFQPGLVVYILHGILRGLERLHAMSFLHSDVKPGNVMIDRLGFVKLVDFGRAVAVGERLTLLLGSPPYMAPEIHRREAGAPSSDIYSAGIMALEMLRGVPVDAGPQPDEAALLEAKLGLSGRLAGLLPARVAENRWLVDILRRMIEPEAQRRFRSAKEADSADYGLRIIDKQLVRADLDSEHARDLADYLALFVDADTDRVDMKRHLDGDGGQRG